MTGRVYKLRIWIGLLAVIFTGLAIERTAQSGHMHGVGEGAVALVLWVLLVWGLVGHHSAAEGREAA
jgi:hypothetical protein